MFHILESWRRSRDILGMNARNLHYLRPSNPRRARRFADEKIACKLLLKKHDLPAPALISHLRSIEELDHFDWSILPGSFALKPNRGFGGEGIVVVYGKKKDTENTWIKADGSLLSADDLRTHIRNILDGSYSLGNTPDSAFFEERLKLLKLFKPYTWKGIPDIRVIVYNSVPVMAMLRLPTKSSGGRANLQQGAIGVGIDLALGTTTSAVWGKNRLIDSVPGTRLHLSGLKIPHWKEILRMSIEAQKASGLGFLGADIAIDRDRGPVFLELNARPGLSIQIANMDGLKARLERVAGLKIKTTEKGMRMGMDLFGGEIEEEVEEISGKKIIGTIEKVKLIGKNGKEVEVEAKIDTGADSTSIDTELARELGFGETVDGFEGRMVQERNIIQNKTKEERIAMFSNIPNLADTAIVKSSNGTSYRPMVYVEIVIDGVQLPAKVSITAREHLNYPVIVGRRNLKKFLIDSNK